MAVGEGSKSAVEQLINTASALGNTTIDLNKKSLKEFPVELLNLQQLEFLYLEGNAITSIPEELFQKLPNLRWLDLRNNRLAEIPCSIGRHRNLRNLLLEGNKITYLPLELGLVKGLSGLNLTGNPLDFPSSSVVERGTQEILKYLRDQFIIRQSASQGLDQGRHPSASSNSSEESLGLGNDGELKKKTHGCRKHRTSSKSVDLPGPVHSPVPLHPPPSARTDRIRLEYDRQRMALHSSGDLETPRSYMDRQPPTRHASGSSSRDSKVPLSSQKSIRSAKIERVQYNIHAEPKFPDYEAKITEEQHLAIETALNEKEYVILQKRKNKKALDDWRDLTRRLKQKKDYLARVQGPPQVNVQAPFGTEKSAVEDEKEKNYNHYTKQLKDIMEGKDKEAPRRALLDRELEGRIKNHIEKLKEHRRKTYNNITDELDAARRNLEMAQKHQRELEDRKGLEYRLRAFTGDDTVPARRTKSHRTKSKSGAR